MFAFGPPLTTTASITTPEPRMVTVIDEPLTEMPTLLSPDPATWVSLPKPTSAQVVTFPLLTVCGTAGVPLYADIKPTDAKAAMPLPATRCKNLPRIQASIRPSPLPYWDAAALPGDCGRYAWFQRFFAWHPDVMTPGDRPAPTMPTDQ